MLGDVLAEIVSGFVSGPSTDRGLIRLFMVLGFLAASSQLVLRVTLVT